MSLGIEWSEHNPGYEIPNNMRIRELYSNNPVEFVLSSKMDSLPGEKFNCSGGFVTLAGRIIEQASGISLGDFAD